MGPYEKGGSGDVKMIANGLVSFSVPELIIKKRDGKKLSSEEIEWFITRMVAGKVEEGQLGNGSIFLPFTLCFVVYLRQLAYVITISFFG